MRACSFCKYSGLVQYPTSKGSDAEFSAIEGQVVVWEVGEVEVTTSKMASSRSGMNDAEKSSGGMKILPADESLASVASAGACCADVSSGSHFFSST